MNDLLVDGSVSRPLIDIGDDRAIHESLVHVDSDSVPDESTPTIGPLDGVVRTIVDGNRREPLDHRWPGRAPETAPDRPDRPGARSLSWAFRWFGQGLHRTRVLTVPGKRSTLRVD